MHDLNTLKILQSIYQEKFAILLKLQEESALSGSDASASPEYLAAKEEWLHAGNELKIFLEQHK